MSETKPYKCVNCGEAAGALFKSYGPSVLKLTKCENCNGIVDKYVEYDPVIVMIDLVLMSREAQRHVIYNTEFKVYWKLFIILMMLETYGVWRNDSLITFGIDAFCKETSVFGNYSFFQSLQPALAARGRCDAWIAPPRPDNANLFIWEKDFYIQFITTFCGTTAFIATTYCLMRILMRLSAQNPVPLLTQLKGHSLCRALCVPAPALAFNASAPPRARAAHHALVAAYGAAVFYNVYTVIHRRGSVSTALVLLLSYSAKLLATFAVMPYVREIVK